MTDEEICKHLQAMLNDKECVGEMTGHQVDAVCAAISALRDRIARKKPEPLGWW